MKKGIIVFTLLLVVGLTGTELMAYRGHGHGYGPGPGRGGMFAPGLRQVMHLNRMQEFLKLSDQQVEKIFKINQKYQEKYFKSRKDYDTVEELALKHRREIKSVLTKEQLKLLDDGRFRRGRGRGRGYGYRDCPRGRW